MRCAKGYYPTHNMFIFLACNGSEYLQDDNIGLRVTRGVVCLLSNLTWREGRQRVVRGYEFGDGVEGVCNLEKSRGSLPCIVPTFCGMGISRILRRLVRGDSVVTAPLLSSYSSPCTSAILPPLIFS